MKKVLSVLMITIMLFSTMMFPVSADNVEISVYLDAAKIEFDVKPQIINGRTMVPIRAIFEKMGAVVEWDGNTSSAICTKGDTVVKMTLNSMDMYINNQLTKMDVSPVVIDGRTLAPARYVAEAFCADVQWSQKNNSVVICSKDVYAYADYPDIPDLGRCYNISMLSETVQDGFKVFSYIYSDMSNDDYYSYLYDNSALVLGKYAEETVDTTNGVVTIAYTKSGEVEPRYFIGASYGENGSMIFVVMIPIEKVVETVENKVTLYALDGRTIEVLESDVSSYLNVGWYETYEEAQAANAPSYSDDYYYDDYEPDCDNQLNSGGSSVYRTPSGKRYHFDPNCGGKNSYETTLQKAKNAGLTPCKKCAW